MVRHLLIITSGDVNKGSTRVRVLNYVSLLKKAGWSVQVASPTRSKRRTARLRELALLLHEAARSDIVWIQKRLFPIWAARFFRICSKRLIYEFDDPIFLDMDGSIHYMRQQALVALLRVADAVTVDNEGLRRFACAFNANVVVLPSCVDTAFFTPREGPAEGKDSFVIGWIGHPSNLPFIEEVEPALKSLHDRHGGQIVLKVVSSEPYHSVHFPVINKRWSLEDEPSDIASFHIGIVPLREYSWTQYKIAYRPYLFMAMERPVVISSVGPSAGIVDHGVDGFTARTTEEWVAALEALLARPELRYAMGKAGRRKVEERFTYQANLSKLLRVLTGTCCERQVVHQEGQL